MMSSGHYCCSSGDKNVNCEEYGTKSIRSIKGTGTVYDGLGAPTTITKLQSEDKPIFGL